MPLAVGRGRWLRTAARRRHRQCLLCPSVWAAIRRPRRGPRAPTLPSRVWAPVSGCEQLRAAGIDTALLRPSVWAVAATCEHRDTALSCGPRSLAANSRRMRRCRVRCRRVRCCHLCQASLPAARGVSRAADGRRGRRDLRRPRPRTRRGRCWRLTGGRWTRASVRAALRSAETSSQSGAAPSGGDAPQRAALCPTRLSARAVCGRRPLPDLRAPRCCLPELRVGGGHFRSRELCTS